MSLDNLPDIEFVSANLEELLNDIITGFEEAYFKSTGKKKTLYPGDPLRIFLYSQALREFQLRKFIDNSAKQNTLKYAAGFYLDHVGSRKGVGGKRLPATKAKTRVKFFFSTIQESAYTIPEGWRATPGNDIFFQTIEPIYLQPGEQEITATLECSVEGIIGNGYVPGQIITIVDPLPYLESIINLDTSSGGSDIEDDESYRERIYLAPEGFSVAGPEGAYIYFTKSFSPLIQDVKVTSPSDAVVDIRVLLNNGEIPSASFLEELEVYMSSKDKRPLTDKVQANAPDVVDYDIDVDYYILSTNSAMEASIKSNVQKAINDYQSWQKGKIGRDIDPSELIARMKEAGAKRVTVRSPLFIDLTDQVGNANTVNVVYGGLEDD